MQLGQDVFEGNCCKQKIPETWNNFFEQWKLTYKRNNNYSQLWLPEAAYQLNAKCFPYRLMNTLIRLFRSAQNYCDLCMLRKKQISGIYSSNCLCNIPHFQKSLWEWRLGKSKARERWTKPGHTSAAILNGQYNTMHRASLHFTYRKKFSNSWLTCLRAPALMLSEFTQVLQQQALSLPSNCQPNYSKIIHTKEAKQGTLSEADTRVWGHLLQ